MFWLFPLALIALLAARSGSSEQGETLVEQKEREQRERTEREQRRARAIAARKAADKRRAEEYARQDKFFEDTRGKLNEAQRDLDQLKKDISELNGEDPHHL